MKVLYFQCNMGAAGDMLNAALLDLIDDKETFLDEFRKLGIPDVKVDLTRTQKCSVTGSHLSVTVKGTEEVSEDVSLNTQDHDHDHEHEHHHEHGHEHGHDHHHDEAGCGGCADAGGCSGCPGCGEPQYLFEGQNVGKR
ncbi:MAG: DUF111 family protein, partial [Oscillospiraceae bacterium]|nr:DUF111 family protein [Oscillospiraceae bacterium]